MTESKDQPQITEAQIASHWREEELIHPTSGFIAQANMADPGVHEAVLRGELPRMLP